MAAPARFHGVAFTGFWTPGYLERVVAALPDGGVTELMTHPAVLDDRLRRGATRLRSRASGSCGCSWTSCPGCCGPAGSRAAASAFFGKRVNDMSNPKVSIVVPFHNEEENIPLLTTRSEA